MLALGIALERERKLYLQQAQQETSTLVSVLEENTARTFENVDIALHGIAIYLVNQHSARHDLRTRELMLGYMKHLPEVRALFVISPDGFIQHDTDYPKTPDVSLADREYFRQYVERPDLMQGLSSAMQSRSGAGWFLASTRKIVSPRGEFLGVLVAAVQLDSFSNLYKKLGLRPGHVMSLFHADGRLIARYPPDDMNIGHSYASLPLFSEHLRHQDAGVYTTNGPPFNTARVLSYRKLDSQPFVVALSTEERVVLAGWHRTVNGAISAVVVFSLLTVAGVFFFIQRQEQKQHKIVLQVLASELTHADRLKTEFLATLSHEMRNVLAPMQNGMSILNHASPGSERFARAHGVVQRQLEQMRRLIDDLLDVARVNSGKVRLERKSADLREILVSVLEAAQTFMDPARHMLKVSLPDGPLKVDVDTVRMQQIFINLLSNAAKYTPPGGHIELQAHKEGSMAVVKIKDDGMGIPVAAQSKVFNMFEQVSEHEAKAQGGLGIGLSLVQRLVALHGGRVEAFSEGLNRGSTFTVYLPLTEHSTPPFESLQFDKKLLTDRDTRHRLDASGS